jgi:hypothetical protein
MSYRDRGYLPHLEILGSTYFVTFRLTGTLPQKVLDDFRTERWAILKSAGINLKDADLCGSEKGPPEAGATNC